VSKSVLRYTGCGLDKLDHPTAPCCRPAGWACRNQFWATPAVASTSSTTRQPRWLS